MPRRRNRDAELNFEIHIDDCCLAEVMDDGPDPFDATDARDATMPPARSANDVSSASQGSDATILNNVETDDVEFNERRQSGLSNASFESDRRPPSRPASDFHESARNSYGSAVDDRHSLGGSEQAGGRHSAGGSSSHHSSHHDQDDDVFSSSHSPRSSMGSNLEADQLKRSHSDAARRMTGGSRISDMQPYDPDEEFVPAVRETPRPPFRSPSSVKAMQMNSPPPSVIGSAPRSSRRAARSSVSRIGSPAISTQYSPKKTPPRFKRTTPPLVLLHVTLLPLRWPWADLMDNARPSELSEAGRTLREAWKQLQTRVGDTVSDRGILLPHPQNDFEILEERLLEAMELPLLRRARILECGHYLGPANETTINDDGELVSDDEDFDEKPVDAEKRHWCSTCQSDIRYDSLGEGKVFRTKVYASNGLMKAGAWDACWKEMERVDVELEPIVDPSVLDELERIAATQEREAIEAEIAASTHLGGADDDDNDDDGAEQDSFSHDNTFDRPLNNEESRKLYEERMREIYGQPDNDGPGAAAAAEHVEPEGPPAQEPAAAPTTTSPKSWPPTGSPPSTTTDVSGRTAWAAELFKYGFRDVLQLIIFILCVLLLQYFGIGFDRKGNDSAALTKVSAPAEVAAVLPQVTHATAAAAAAAAVNEVSVEEVFAEKVSVNDASIDSIFLDSVKVDDVATSIASAEPISAGSSTAVDGGFASAAARSGPGDAYGESSYAACTSALEAAEAALALASATATVTVTETVSISMATAETQAVDEQPDAPPTTGVSPADDLVEEDDKAVESTHEADEKTEL